LDEEQHQQAAGKVDQKIFFTERRHVDTVTRSGNFRHFLRRNLGRILNK